MKKPLEEKVIIFGEVGYVGKKGKEIEKKFDNKFGPKHWSKGWYIDGIIGDWWDALDWYEEAYYHFLKDNNDIRNWLINTASEVYDINPSNVKSGMNYLNQECGAMHYQDIAVRRVLTRLKLEEWEIDWPEYKLPEIPIFKGDHLVQIRGHESEGYILNPGQVPFPWTEIIVKHENERDTWWKKGSVEEFYQKNKILVIDPKNFPVQIAAEGENDFFLEYNKQDYYRVDREKPNHLWYNRGRKARKIIQDGNYTPKNSFFKMYYSSIKNKT